MRANLDNLRLPTISIIIPAYKRPRMLYCLLLDLAKQCHTDFREVDVVVVNDGSHDDYYERLYDKHFAKFPFPFKYIARDRREDGKPAPCATINHGVRESQGEVILILDDGLFIDDHTIFIHRLLHMLLREYHPAVFPYEYNRIKAIQYPHPFCVSQGELINVWVTRGGSSFRHEDWDIVGGLDEVYDGSLGFDDRDLAIRLYKAGCNIIYADGITRFNDDWESGGSWVPKLAPLDNHRNGRIFSERWPEYDGHTWGQ